MSRIGAGVKGGLITTAVYAGGVYAIGKLLDSLPKPAYPPGYDPEAEFNKSTFDRIKEIVGLKERDPLLPPKTDGVPVQDRVSSAWDASPVSSAPVLLDPSPDLKDTARLPPQRPKALAPDRPTPLQPERPADFSQGTSQIPRHDVGRIDEVFAQAKMSDPGQLAGAMDAAMKQMQTSIQTGFAQALAEADRFMAQMNAKLSQTLAPTIRPRVDMSGIRGIHADTGVE